MPLKLVTEYLLKNFYGMHLIGETLTGIMGIKIILIRITAVSVPVPVPAWTRIPFASNIFYDIGGKFALQQICRYKFGFSLFPGAEAIYQQTF